MGTGDEEGKKRWITEAEMLQERWNDLQQDYGHSLYNSSNLKKKSLSCVLSMGHLMIC